MYTLDTYVHLICIISYTKINFTLKCRVLKMTSTVLTGSCVLKTTFGVMVSTTVVISAMNMVAFTVILFVFILTGYKT